MPAAVVEKRLDRQPGVWYHVLGYPIRRTRRENPLCGGFLGSYLSSPDRIPEDRGAHHKTGFLYLNETFSYVVV